MANGRNSVVNDSKSTDFYSFNENKCIQRHYQIKAEVKLLSRVSHTHISYDDTTTSHNCNVCICICHVITGLPQKNFPLFCVSFSWMQIASVTVEKKVPLEEINIQ